MPFFVHCPSLTIVGVGVCVIVCARHFAIVAANTLIVVSRCEGHREDCDVDQQTALSEDDVMDLLQVDLRLHSNWILPVSRQPTKQESEAKMPMPAERFVEEESSTKNTKVVGQQVSVQIEVVPPSSSSGTPLRADKGQIDHNVRHNVSAVVSDIGFHSPLRVFSMLGVSSLVNPAYSHAHWHGHRTELLGSSTSNRMGIMPILVVMPCVIGIPILICVVLILTKDQKHPEPKNCRLLQCSGAAAATQTPFEYKGESRMKREDFDTRLEDANAEPAKVKLMYEDLVPLTMPDDSSIGPDRLASVLMRLTRVCLEIANGDPQAYSDLFLKRKAISTRDFEVKSFRHFFLLEGRDAASRAVELNPNCAYAHKWLAIVLSLLDPFADGTRERIELSRELKKHADIAAAKLPNDAYVFQVLSEFCLNDSKLSWFERRAAAALSTLKALQYSLKACEILEQPHHPTGLDVRNAENVAKCYSEMGKIGEARTWFEKALALPTKNEEEKERHEAIKKQLSTLR